MRRRYKWPLSRSGKSEKRLERFRQRFDHARVCFRAREAKPITNIAQLEKETRDSLASCAPRPCKNMDCKSLTATVSSFSRSAHPVVILSRAWNFLRFPSTESTGCEERRTGRATGTGRGTRIHAAGNTKPVRYVFAELWVDLHIETVRGCETDLPESRQSGEGWHLDTTSVLNLRRWPIRSLD